MSVTEIGFLHGRYVRLSDRFKAYWTYNQFASGAYKTLLQAPLPYRIDFQRIYDSIRSLADMLHTTALKDAANRLDQSEREVAALTTALLKADDAIKPSVLRRFLEMLKQADDKILHNLIKFYLYAGAIDGDRRDKIDYLFTNIGENFAGEHGEYWTRDTYELRRVVQSLTHIHPQTRSDDVEVHTAVRSIRGLKEEILAARDFEELSRKRLLENVRDIKHRIGDLYLHPDVLIAIIECNVTTRSRFSRLFQDEEQRILEESERLAAFEDAIRAEPRHSALLDEIEKFRHFKGELDESIAKRNVKHNTLSQLRQSMSNIISQLETGLEGGAQSEALRDFLLQAQQSEIVQRKFGADPLLQEPLVRIIGVLETFDPFLAEEQVTKDPRVAGLRLEPWEVGAYRKLYASEPLTTDETEDMMLLYLRAAALRNKMDDRAKAMVSPGEENIDLVFDVSGDLDYAHRLDRSFGELLEQAIYYSDQRLVHRLYRSRFRLLRAFSGLWLVNDQKTFGAAPAEQ